jgi:CheY-like chemotaxis protein
MVQGMAAQLGGTVVITSRVGQGTSVSVFLPRAEANAAKDQDTEVSPPDKGNGRILIVEDEPGVLDFLNDALRDLGYETIAAADTTSALSLVEQGEQLDAVLSDYKLPGMTGTELLARICQIRPGLKGMLVTGNPDAIEEFQISLPVLKKPFSIAALAAHLRVLLHTEAD